MLTGPEPWAGQRGSRARRIEPGSRMRRLGITLHAGLALAGTSRPIWPPCYQKNVDKWKRFQRTQASCLKVLKPVSGGTTGKADLARSKELQSTWGLGVGI